MKPSIGEAFMLFVDFLGPNTIRAEVIVRAHAWLKNHIQDSEAILPVRNSGRFGSPLHNAANHRGKLVHLGKSRVASVFSDNEMAVWLYDFFSGNPKFEQSFQSMLVNKIIPVAHARAHSESDKKFKLQVVSRPWGREINHKHIFDAGLPKSSNLEEMDRKDIVSKFLRLVHPFNHFLFPVGLGYDAEQNSRPEFQFVAAKYMQNKLPSEFDEFIDLIDLSSFGWAPNWQDLANINYNTLCIEFPSMQLDVYDGSKKDHPNCNKVIYVETTRFKVDEKIYQKLCSQENMSLIIKISKNRGKHPEGTYCIPNSLARRFVESKRQQPHWIKYQYFSSQTVPVSLREFFKKK
jgi:hypothetical protein